MPLNNEDLARYVGSLQINAAAPTVYSNLRSDYLGTACILSLYLLVMQYLNLSQVHILCREAVLRNAAFESHISRPSYTSSARHLI